MFDDFLVRALLGGVGVALATGPLGCFVVWRRMAYVGDTVAHAALLGVAGGIALGIAPMVGVLVVALAAALILAGVQGRRLASDTALGILAHASLALGLLVAGMLPGLRIDLMSYLFGDLLAVGRADLAWIWAGSLAALAALAVLWRPLLATTIDGELARAEGVPTRLVSAAYMALVALVVALAMKAVGVLLVTALLIIPAAAARPFSRTPESMAAYAAVAGAVSVALGLAGSYAFDAPAGPAAVVAAALLFLIGLGVAALRVRRA